MPSKSTRQSPASPDSAFRAAPLRFVRQQYLRFLQGLFWYRPKGSLHWNPDDEVSDIYIADEATMHASVIGARPAISITRAPVNMLSLGFDDMVRLNEKTGTKTKSIMMPGTMSINFCSREPQESEDLASWTAEHLWLLRDIMQRAGFFQVGQHIAIGSPSPAGSIINNDGGKEWYATTATSPYQIQRTGTVTPLGQYIARGIEVMLTGHGAPAINPMHYAPATQQQMADLSSFDENDLSVSGDRVEDPTDKPLPGAEYELTLHGYTRRGERAPKIRGQRLPLHQEDVGESAKRGINAIRIKV